MGALKLIDFTEELATDMRAIRNTCRSRARLMGLDADDLFSYVNYKLARVVYRGEFVGNKPSMVAYINAAILNAALEMKRNNYNKLRLNSLDYDDLPDGTFKVQPESYRSDQKVLLADIRKHILLNQNSRTLLVFDEHFINGGKYEEIAALTGIGLNTVKTIIRRIRIIVNETFIDRYKELYN